MKLIISLALSIGGSTSQSLAGILSLGLRGRVKDRLEDRLHALVISRKLDLETAQREIATDWIAATKNTAAPHLIPAAIVLVMPDRRRPIRAAIPRRQVNPLQLRFG
jgi:hypothetical protein